MKKYKKTSLESYTLGTTLTLELLTKKIEYVLRVYIHSKQEKNETYKKIIKICENNHIEVIYSDKIINSLSDKENCYVIGVFKKYQENINFSSNHIVLVNPSNMGNLGTIIRSSVGFSIFDLVIIQPGVDIFDPKVIRSSMGAIFNMRFQYFNSFLDYMKMAKDRNYYPFMLKAKTDLKCVLKKEPYSLIFGPEASGLSDDFLEIGTPLIIKHNKMIDSLNLDNAVSIALYEFTKNPDDANIVFRIIKQTKPVSQTKNDESYALAYTTLDIDGKTLKKAYIDFFDKGKTGEYLRAYSVLAVAVHEFGHAIGL